MSLTATDSVFPEANSPEARPLARIFGVRHLSPAAAHHLHDVLEQLRPTAVLVEGPSDATDQIRHLVHKDTRPPLALLAYTQDRPVHPSSIPWRNTRRNGSPSPGASATRPTSALSICRPPSSWNCTRSPRSPARTETRRFPRKRPTKPSRPSGARPANTRGPISTIRTRPSLASLESRTTRPGGNGTSSTP